jgi:TonB family protein
VRNLGALVPKLLDAVGHESDAGAQREEVRAIVILGTRADVDRIIKLPMRDVIARAAARRADAYDIYVDKLRPLGFLADAAFFEQSLWQRGNAVVAISARTLGRGDGGDWGALLAAMRASRIAMDANILSVSLGAPSEEIRTQSVWYVVHGYAFDPSKIDPRVRAALAAPKEEASLREAFGRELLRRMLGGERKQDPRWRDWLQTIEADDLIGSEVALFEYFTDAELAARKNHCDIAKNDCRIPPGARKPVGAKIASAEVRQPAFQLPDVLPPGLADAVVREAGCGGDWLATGEATVDLAGRVRELKLTPVTMSKGCERAVSTLARLSLASTESLAAPARSGDLLFIHVRGTPVCLDETGGDSIAREVGNGVSAPVVKHRVEPQFPASARRQMGGGHYVVVMVQATITKDGCVRNLRLVQQSPYADLNTAALVALEQWRFEPGRIHGEPTDVLFMLTVNFMIP